MSDDLERAARLANLAADTEYKRMLTKWEPWKAMAIAAGAGASFMAAAVALAALVIAHLR